MRLLNLSYRDNPNDPLTLLYLGWSYLDQGHAAEALPFLQRSFECSTRRDDPVVAKLLALLAWSQRELRHSAEAWMFCRRGRERFPDDVELLFLEGDLLREQGDLIGAEQALLRVLDSKPQLCFGSIDDGLRTYRARHSLALVYRQQDRIADAAAQWGAALEERPDFAPARLGLSELHGAQHHVSEQSFRNNRGELAKNDREDCLAESKRATLVAGRSNQWTIQLPSVRRRCLTLAAALLFGASLGALLPLSNSPFLLLLALAAVATLSGFSALWSP